MTSHNLHYSQCNAPDALLDIIEHKLLALTTADLDEDDALPAQCVDEFSTEFLLSWNTPSG